ncbi:metal ABC transporter substrate-binding protein [Paenibacillus wulumuqiensis]|uniref:metal ABC transporter substrate-binding protein n=1 Tax=Paenibacillus wulumuqiensis TaxID=1567107 RepID=UPI0006199EC2|nr:metal ABC transporter substrate-binding protein [Paenibacillus wulumuqiensis]
MKSSKALFITLSLSFILVIAGCGANKEAARPANSTSTPANTAKLDIKTTFYPMYDFTRNVVGKYGDVENLVPTGVEPHDWEPTAKDLAEITDANVLVYNGAGMEDWIDQVKESATGGHLMTVEASQGINISEETEAEHEHNHSAEHEEHSPADHEHHSDEETDQHDHDHGGLDPHVWLSPALAVQEVRNIEAALSQAAPEHKDDFKRNADAYIAKLEALDQEFKTELQNTQRKDFITQHAAFGYLAKEYGLTQVPIAGLSPDQEPSAEQMAEIVNFAKEHNIKTIFFETLASTSVAEAIANEIGAKSDVLNPIEGLTKDEMANGADYISVMKQNLTALKKALNE